MAFEKFTLNEGVAKPPAVRTPAWKGLLETQLAWGDPIGFGRLKPILAAQPDPA